MILEPISIASSGYVGVAPAGFCPLPLAIGSDGYIRFRIDDAAMADPRTFSEPFDLGYYRTKYGRRRSEAPLESIYPERDIESDREGLRALLDALELEEAENALLRAERRAELARIEQERLADAELAAQNELLQARARRAERESQALERAMDRAARQIAEMHALMLELMERQRRQRNAEAAIAATLTLFFNPG